MYASCLRYFINKISASNDCIATCKYCLHCQNELEHAARDSDICSHKQTFNSMQISKEVLSFLH